jgi:hypothetical protein
MPNTFKIRLWAVLGEGGTGKTSVIGNLISQYGRGPGGFRHVPLRGSGYLQIYARRQSLQEAKRSVQEVLRETKRVASRLETDEGLSIGYLNVLFAIRTDKIRGLPPASEYLSEFVRAGWILESLAILNYNERKHGHYYSFGAPTLEVYDSIDIVRQPARHHWLVGPVRNHFGWA